MSADTSTIRSAPSEAGFTLLEMLIVLGLLGMIAAVSLPLLRGGARTGLIERTAARLAADLTSTRLAAIKQNIASHLDFDLAANSYSGTPRLTARAMPVEIPISVRTTESGPESPPLARIQFFPNGSSAGGRIVVGSGGQSRIITIDRLTGMVRISREP